MRLLLSRRTLALVAWGYAVKALLLGLVWVLAPDVAERALLLARSAFGD